MSDRNSRFAVACLGVALGWLLLGQLPALAAPSVRASLDRDTVPVGESVTLVLAFEEVGPGGTPNLPALPNLTVGGVTQSSEMTIVNGVTTSRQSFKYTLVPTQPGDITIPAMQIVVGGRPVVTQPLVLHVVKANTPTGEPQLAFLKLVVPKMEVYFGEPFPVDIQLYWQNANNLRLPQLAAAGFSVTPSSQNSQPPRSQQQVGNLVYNVAVFKMSVTAARTGALVLGPAETSLTVLIPTGQRSIFGANYQQRETKLTSEAITMRVLPLPTQNIPPGFNGAVGSFQLAVTAGPTNVAVGDPITVKAKISGNGLFDALILPPQTQWRDFTSYPATSKIDSNDPLGLSGVKSFEQVVIPQNHEVNVLPSLLFSYFDPNLKAYRTLSNAPIPLTVRATAAVAAPPSLTNSSAATPPPVDDILHIKPRLDNDGVPGPLLAQQPWFLSLQTVPVLAWLALLVWRKRKESLANNPRLRRQREVAQRVREGLKQLRAQADAGKSEDFYMTLFRVLQEQLGERLDLPASAITEAVIDERLRARGLAEPVLAGLHALFQSCNLARYAPTKSSQELAALIPKLESVLGELQNLKA